MRLYLFHAETRTFICTARHHSTFIEALYRFIGVEFRAVRGIDMDRFSVPHLTITDEVDECPPWLWEHRIAERHKEVQDWVSDADEAEDERLALAEIKAAGIYIDDYPVIDGGAR